MPSFAKYSTNSNQRVLKVLNADQSPMYSLKDVILLLDICSSEVIYDDNLCTQPRL